MIDKINYRTYGRSFPVLARRSIMAGFAASMALGLLSLTLHTRTVATQEMDKSVQPLDRNAAVEFLKMDSAYASLPEAIAAATGGADPTYNPRAVTKLTADDGVANASFGWSVAVSGSTAVVGAPGTSPSPTNAVYIFLKSGNGWALQQKLVPPGGTGGNFGSGVAIEGDTVVIGRRFYAPFGAAYVYTRSGTIWTLEEQLTPPSGNTVDAGFGRSVAISGETVIVGDHSDNSPALRQGSAYVYIRNGTAWTQQQKLTASDGSQTDSFGWSVAISGGQAIIGAWGQRNGSSDPNIGAAYVFERENTGWTQKQKLTAFDGVGADEYGRTVNILGNTAVVGAHSDDIGPNVDQGSAYVYVRSGLSWTLEQKLTAPDGGMRAEFGESIAISEGHLVIGAYVDDIGPNVNQGSAYIYSRCAPMGTPPQKILASDGAAQDTFGNSVAVSGDTVLIGARGDTIGANNRQGSAYAIPLADIGLAPEGYRPSGGPCEFGIEVNITTDQEDFDLEDEICDVDAMMNGPQCSLRAAIQTANASESITDLIKFNIPGGGVQTISPSSALPAITGNVNIDGTTQPGYAGSPVIELRGDLTGGDGLVFATGSAESRLNGLTINRFKNTGGNIRAGVTLQSEGNTIENCIIGLNSDGLQVDSANVQGFGVRILASNNTVGGTRGAGNSPNNIIAGNDNAQVYINGSSVAGNKVKGSNLGINAANEPPAGTFFNGVLIKNGPTNSEIGGSGANEWNYITSQFGVRVENEGAGNIGRNIIAGNRIAGCLVGIRIENSGENTIGGNIGTDANNSRNYLWGNGTGISIENTTGISTLVDENKIFGNVIGSAPNGSYTGNEFGIGIDKAENNFVGDGTLGHRNIISANHVTGVSLGVESKANIVRGNYIGTDLEGSSARGNGGGIAVLGINNRIVENTIAGNDNGVDIGTAGKSTPPPAGTVVDSNRIGISAGGNDPIPNGIGISLFSGITSVTTNIISGNDGYGITIYRNGNNVTNNKIGTDPTGTTAIGNGFNHPFFEAGVDIRGTQNVVSGNTISGNKVGLQIAKGIQISDPTPSNNRIEGNFIGTNSNGTAAVANATHGIKIGNNAIDNMIGGVTAGTGNVISGNGGNGIHISIIGVPGAVAPFETKVKGNRIGTNAAGTAAIRNVGAGISIEGAISSRIGGVTTEIPAARNIISGNGGDGIRISDTGVVNRVQGNYIGVGADGTSPLGNTGNGVTIASGSASNIIGGTEDNSGNVIAHNTNGVLLAADAGAGNLIDPNRIFANLLLGIDIGGDGFTPNDPTDADVGPNKRQNYPTFTLAVVGGDLIVSYQVDSAPQHSSYGANGIYVEFFEADSTGAGRDFLGFDHFLLSDYNNGAPGTRQKNLGNAATLGIVAGDRLTATATDADGNSSEFNPAVTLAAPPITISGRVTTPTGLGLRNAVVTLVEPSGSRRTATTSSFGIYSFANVPSGQNYTISVTSKRYRFAPRIQVISQSVSDLDFVGLE